PSTWDCWSSLTVPSALYPGVTVPLVWNHQRTTRPPASCVFLKMVLKASRSGFGTSLAKFTHATLSPLEKSHTTVRPPSVPASLTSPGAVTPPLTGGAPSVVALPADIPPAGEASEGPTGSAV